MHKLAEFYLRGCGTTKCSSDIIAEMMDAALCAVPCGQKQFFLKIKQNKQTNKRSEPASSDDRHELQLATTRLELNIKTLFFGYG